MYTKSGYQITWLEGRVKELENEVTNLSIERDGLVALAKKLLKDNLILNEQIENLNNCMNDNKPNNSSED